MSLWSILSNLLKMGSEVVFSSVIFPFESTTLFNLENELNRKPLYYYHIVHKYILYHYHHYTYIFHQLLKARKQWKELRSVPNIIIRFPFLKNKRTIGKLKGSTSHRRATTIVRNAMIGGWWELSEAYIFC